MTQPKPGQSWANAWAGVRRSGDIPLPPTGGPRQLTPEQHRALSRINRLRIVNLILLFYFILSVGIYAGQAAEHSVNQILTGVIALLLLVLMVRNKVVKSRLRRRHDVQ